jgi:uncharacterized protein (UPF0303 family)
MTDEIAALEAREHELTFDAFDLSTAWTLGSAAAEIIQAEHYSLAVQIVLGGRVVFKAAFNGVSQDTEPWLTGKAAAALLFESSSMRVRLRKDADPGVVAGLDHDTYRTHGGSVPIRVRGRGIVGTITVSGEPDVIDHAVAMEALQRTHVASLEQSG